MSPSTSFIAVNRIVRVVRPVLDQIEEMLAGGAESEGLVSLALVAGSSIELPEEELNGAIRRAMLLLAASGDPTRELELDGRAVTALAADLDTAARRDELAERLAALRAPRSGYRWSKVRSRRSSATGTEHG